MWTDYRVGRAIRKAEGKVRTAGSAKNKDCKEKVVKEHTVGLSSYVSLGLIAELTT
jgi:hypothetical protein